MSTNARGAGFVASLAASAACLAVFPALSLAGEINLATLTCGKYENEVLPAAAESGAVESGDAASPGADSIDTVMWLFGYSVAKSGAHVMYADALTPFGFALDGECKSNPAESVLNALSIVKPESKHPMDLAGVECAAFASRHRQFAHSDADSAKTIMLWLFGFAVASAGGHLFDAASWHAFESSLLDDCDKHPQASLLDTLKKAQIPGHTDATRARGRAGTAPASKERAGRAR